MLDAGFFDRSAEEVAVSLLGCYLVKDKRVSRIVETEAYFGGSDPGSRAKSGKKKYNAPMFDGPGKLFVYNVHKYWMLNVSTRPVGAVLIRAVEPLNFSGRTSGPGNLTRALEIDKSFSAKTLGRDTGIWIERGRLPGKIGLSNRIGLTKDLPEPLRFFDLESDWVSASRKAVTVLG